LFLIITIGFGCKKDEIKIKEINDDSSITTINGTWVVKSYENYGNQSILLKDEKNSWGHDVVITFSEEKEPHQFYGKNTTNSISGEFKYLGKRKISFENYISTYVNQPEWADKFNQALEGGEFKINNTHLRIYFNENKESVTLIKQDD
jgi:hypothetical protein